MDYAVAAFESFGDLLSLVHVRLYEGGTLRDIRLESGAEVVKDYYIRAGFDEVMSHMAADIAGSACD
jgi:hypothetical protein